MENKINIAELLKDCPSGMPLDCTSYDNVLFDKISNDKKAIYPIFCYITDKEGNRSDISFTENGCESKRCGAKCVIFPKGKTTWEGFHKPFNDGDIVHFITKHDNEYIAIFKNNEDVYLETHIDYAVITSRCSLDSLFYIDNIKEQRLATEKEKAKLFQAIKNNGYKWNNNTKLLTKLKEIKEVKDGDILISELGSIFIVKNPNNNNYHYGCYIALDYTSKLITDCTQLCNKKGCRFATRSEKQKLFAVIAENNYYWDAKTKTLTKLVKPIFEVGNKIEKCGYRFTIAQITDDYYLTKCGNKIPINSQDTFSLVPNKIDVIIFKPFDKVLVRDTNDSAWRADFYSHYEDNQHYPYVCTGDGYHQCIHYNEETADLVGTTNDCPDKYKIWKDE